MIRAARWVGEHPLADWRWPAAAAAAMFGACVLVALVTILGSQNQIITHIRDRGEQSICQQQIEAEFEKAVGHALTVDRTDPSAIARVRDEISVSTAKLEHVADICPTK